MIVRNVAQQAVFHPEKMGKASLGGAAHLYAGLNAFEPGQEHHAHVHADQDKLYFVLQGHGEVTIGAETAELATGDMAIAPAGVVHSLRNTGAARLLVLVVFSPPPSKAG